MSRSRRPRALLALALTTALAVSACSAGDDDSGGPGGSTASITVAVGTPDHLNPGRQTVAFDQAQALFTSLTAVDEDGELVMAAAESVESPDGTTWTVRLKQGWTFHDGTPVTAKNYVDAWNAVAYGPNAWENNGQMAAIAGYADLNPAEGEPVATTMSGLAVVDDTTFTVTLTAPDGQFPYQLSQGQTGFYPLPDTALADPDAFDARPVGNGPFRATGAWEPDQPLTLTAYPDYAGEEPTVDEITFQPYTDMTTAYTDVQAGNADVLFLPADKYTAAAADFGDRLHTFDAPGISYLGLPLDDPRYADVRVRQAISMAVDRDAVNRAVYGGLYEPATAWTPPAEAGTPEGICGRYCEFDPAAAKALLAQAGGFSGTMEVVYPGGVGLDTVYEAYANQLRQNLGLADVVARPSSDWASFASARTAGEMTGPFFSRWGALYPSQQNTLRAFFTTTGGCAPCVAWKDPATEAAIAAADRQVDQAAAEQGYAAAQELVQAAFPAAPMFFETYSYVTSEDVAGLPAANGSPILSKVELVS
ncbi:peptide ABC transporter substrate-binding protein [Kineococcus sp. SYSU DK001]|uniref:peptide ABC transporter substrate-binding protein n=1 Tax=Kineococcus sp. SYSU DK001 TaxID=3383122 RepID=UPI003D7D44E9